MTKRIIAIVVAVAICLTLTVVALTSMAGDPETSKALTLISDTVTPVNPVPATNTSFDGSDKANGILAMTTGNAASGFVGIAHTSFPSVDLTGYRYLAVDVNIPNADLDAYKIQLQLRSNGAWDKITARYTSKDNEAPVSGIAKNQWVTLVYTVKENVTAEQLSKADGCRLAFLGSANSTPTQVKFKNLTAYKTFPAAAAKTRASGDVLMDTSANALYNQTGSAAVQTVSGKSAYGYTAAASNLQQFIRGELGHNDLSAVDGVKVAFYVSDVSKISGLTIELCSFTSYDHWEIQYNNVQSSLQNGWNDLILDIKNKSDSGSVVKDAIGYSQVTNDGGFEVGNCNYVRMFASLTTDVTVGVSSISAYKAQTASSEVSSEEASSQDASSATSSEDATITYPYDIPLHDETYTVQTHNGKGYESVTQNMKDGAVAITTVGEGECAAPYVILQDITFNKNLDLADADYFTIDIKAPAGLSKTGNVRIAFFSNSCPQDVGTVYKDAFVYSPSTNTLTEGEWVTLKLAKSTVDGAEKLAIGAAKGCTINNFDSICGVRLGMYANDKSITKGLEVCYKNLVAHKIGEGSSSSEDASSETVSVDTKDYLIEAREGEAGVGGSGKLDMSKNDYGDGTNGAYWATPGNAANPTIIAERKFDTPLDLSSVKTLTLWVYMDAKALGSAKNGQIELCSGGKCDTDEMSFTGWEGKLNEGWNKLVLDIQNSGATAASGMGYSGNKADLTKINYLRVYTFCEGTVGVGAFYVTPAGVNGGDYTNILLIVAALTLAGGAALTTIFCGKKAR